MNILQLVIMSEFDGLPGDHPDLDSSESKSSASHESGLCSTMLAMDDCLGSLEELSQHVDHELNSHFDHADRLQYELEILRAQLAEKNRLISIQQSTIKKLQDSLVACQMDIKEIRTAAETEIMCKNETISILQSDLVESQQQYADCFQQVISKDRILSEIRDDDVILMQKLAQLEIQLRKKSSQSATTQTDEPSLLLTRSTPPPYKPPPPVFKHRDRQKEESFGNFDAQPENSWSTNTTIHARGYQSPLPSNESRNHSTLKNPKSEYKLEWNSQELLDEMRQIQKVLERPAEPHQCFHRCSKKSNEDMSGFWNAFTEERQQRIQLEHLIRKMELDMIEVKNEVQSCKARLQIQQQQSTPVWNSCCLNKPTVAQSCSCCFRDSCVPRSTTNSTTHLYTLV